LPGLRGEKFTMKPGNLAFSLTIFCAFALSAIGLMLLRRTKLAGEYHRLINVLHCYLIHYIIHYYYNLFRVNSVNSVQQVLYNS